MSAFTRIRRSFQHRAATARSTVNPPATIRRAAFAAIEPMEARQLMSASSFDTAFSGNGKATAALANFNGAATSVDVGKDGSVFVASSAGEDFVITKFLANGNLDTNWGTNGRATVDFGGMDTAADIAATNYGGCVITGQSYIGGHTYMAVAKLNTDGSTYNGFDGDGRKLIQFEVDTYYGDVDSDSVGASLVIQDDGRIVVAGTAYFQIPNYNVTDSVVAVARLNSNGSFDTSFSGDGKMTHEYFKYQPYQRDSAYAVTLDQSARILVGGASEGSWSMVRLLANGSVDGSFEQANVTMGSSGQINAIDVAAGGRIFAAGYAYTQATGSDWAIACFKSNGGLKQGFDGDGRMIIPINGAYSTETLTGIAWQNNNKIVVAGTGSISGAAVDMTVLKMHDTGVADTSFGFAGYKFIDFGNTKDTTGGMVLQDNGRIVVAGSYMNAGKFGIGRGIGVARLEGDHVLPSFGVEQLESSVDEGGNAVARFRIKRYNGFTEGPVTVHFQLNGTAVNGSDYDQIANTITFQAGEVSKIVTIKAKDDTTAEATEFVTLKLVQTSDYWVSGSQIQKTIAIYDNEPPPAPSNAQATASTSSQVYVSWTDNAPNEKGFVVQYSKNSNFTNALTKTASVNYDNYHSTQLTGLQAQTKYYVRVRAFNDIDNSPWSNVVQVTTL